MAYILPDESDEGFNERLAEKWSDLQAAIKEHREPADILSDYEARRLLRADA